MSPAEWQKAVPANWNRENCRCCVHQRRLANWKRAEWCKPYCVYAHFPEETQLVWELTQRCLVMVPIVVPAGMGAATQIEWQVSSDEFRLQMQMGQIPVRHWEGLREQVASFLSLWSKYKDGKTPFGPQEMALLRTLSVLGEAAKVEMAVAE